MTYEIADILRDVRVTLDQNQEETILLEDADTLQLDALIREKIEECALLILENAPLRLIDDVSHVDVAGKESENVWTGRDNMGVCRVELPDDWLRLVCAKMESWRAPVRVSVDDSSEVAIMAKSRYKGIRASVTRPVVIATEGEGGEKVLELLGSADSGDRLELLSYVAIPKITVEGGEEYLHFPEKLYPALVNEIAGKVGFTWNDSRAKGYLEMSQGYMVNRWDGQIKPE